MMAPAKSMREYFLQGREFKLANHDLTLDLAHHLLSNRKSDWSMAS